MFNKYQNSYYCESDYRKDDNEINIINNKSLKIINDSRESVIKLIDGSVGNSTIIKTSCLKLLMWVIILCLYLKIEKAYSIQKC